MSQEYPVWKRRADLLHKAQRAMQDARDAVGALMHEGRLPGDMVRPLMASRDRQDEAGMWLTQAIEQHQLAGRPEGMSRQDTGRDLQYLGANTGARCPRCGGAGQPHPLPNVVGSGWWTCTAGHGDFQGHESKAE